VATQQRGSSGMSTTWRRAAGVLTGPRDPSRASWWLTRMTSRSNSMSAHEPEQLGEAQSGEQRG
jgi:hypothetical protein